MRKRIDQFNELRLYYREEVRIMRNRIDQLEQALCKALNLLTDHGIDNDLPEDIAELWAVYNNEEGE